MGEKKESEQVVGTSLTKGEVTLIESLLDQAQFKRAAIKDANSLNEKIEIMKKDFADNAA